MKPFLIGILLLLSFHFAGAQDAPEYGAATRQGFSGTFPAGTKVISFGLGFPNLYRIAYKEPEGYTHIKTTGFGPMYAKFEIGMARNLGLAAAFGYSSFHYSYFGLAIHPGYTEQVIYYDDVNTICLSLSANYHFSDFIRNPRIDLYAGAGIALNHLRYRYGNIPPYKTPESKSLWVPAGRIGLRYYFDPVFGVFGEAGYDGLSILQLGLSVKF